MTIDAKKLEEAIAIARNNAAYIRDRDSVELRSLFEKERADALDMLADAASAYAATLPREVTFESWATFFRNGSICSSGLTEKEAREYEEKSGGREVAVRLTGKAILPRVKD